LLGVGARKRRERKRKRKEKKRRGLERNSGVAVNKYIINSKLPIDVHFRPSTGSCSLKKKKKKEKKTHRRGYEINVLFIQNCLLNVNFHQDTGC